jgi:hypothetical protein
VTLLFSRALALNISYMDIQMKLLLAIILATATLSVNAGSIYKCEDANGNMSFSGEPCETAAASLGSLGKTSSNNSKLKNTSIKKVIINNQDDFNAFADSLSFNNISHVLKGLQKNRFHGVKITYLLSQKNIQYKDTHPRYEKINYLVDIKQGQAENSFAVNYALKVRGKEDHKFLSLTNKQVISRMKSLGFGQPKVSNGQHNWAWRYGNVSCNFLYSRSKYKPVKRFEYFCSVPNQV